MTKENTSAAATEKEVVEKERTGKLIEFYDFETGKIIDDKNGKEHLFYNPEAQKRLSVNDQVAYVLLTTPEGRKIVKQIIKK